MKFCIAVPNFFSVIMAGCLFLTHIATYQFKCTKQEVPDGGDIQRGVRAGTHTHFVHIVRPAIFFWNIWREMSQISVSDDADCACGVPNCRQQTDDNFRDYSERCQEFSWALHVMLCSIFNLNGTIKEQNNDSNDVLLMCRLPVTHVYTGLFISPSGISELDCATTKTDTAERSISIGRESLLLY